ncbi:MAG: CPBP family intramembrane metalloprotease [Actinobacteria bacterium]|nr:CPBP family intramembrane metalloprotease [Actinomycetota bacterium]
MRNFDIAQVRSVSANAAIALTIFALFVYPYLSWNGLSPTRYLIPDLVIAALIFARFRADALRRLGFAIPMADCAIASLLFGLGTLIATVLVRHLAESREIEVIGTHALFTISQVLHQEIVLHALLLGFLSKYVKSQPALAVGPAAVFAAVHPLHYWWFFGAALPLSTIATLFFFGVAMNVVFIRTRHVAYSLAIHAAWNLARFGDQYFVRKRTVFESQTFAEIEGSEPVLAAALLLLGVTIIVPGLHIPTLRTSWSKPHNHE